VVHGRGLDSLFVDSIGQGRVWSGVRAKELGLVDLIGGLDLAIEIAAKKAGITEYGIMELPKHESQLEKIMKSLGQEQMKEKMLREEMGEFYDTYIMVQKMRSQQGMMARMPVDIIIK
jgi:protease-4